ncbi:MAG: hypothetical protein GWN07_34670, partial [Actinobacteria bacterium]|nr:hypothetical protein [Actinomycetota bacterium]NIS35966.1 hypothetical protein [Actinomycetota bacterium]NIU71417.1 hypothetical protein [Actinomycetota bacterium]NIW32458.1 hypothetical protein [Actinomycetota bacterium]NIX24672.1 hypothetical protein [Actinomycetota bacterium]
GPSDASRFSDGAIGDAGPFDAGPIEAGSFDSGHLDAGPFDGSSPDGGSLDAGPNPLSPRVDNTSCTFPIDGTVGSYSFPDAFPVLPDFARPLWVGHAPGEPAAIYVAEQGGVVHVFDHRRNVATRTEFLRRPVSTVSNEEGFLGLAFHPDYAVNGRFFIHYSRSTGCPGGADRCGVIAERRRQSPRVADPTFEREVLVVPQPH